MSEPTGPVRRRRIAGESKPAAPASKPVARNVPTRKAVAKKAAQQKAATPPPAAPTTSVVAPYAARQPSNGPAANLRWLVLATVVVLVLGIALAVKGVLERTGGDDDLQDPRAQASATAGSAAETIFSFRYDQLDEHVSASKALMTKSFAKDFDKIAPALTELAPQRKIQVQAVTREAAPLACGDECSPTKVNVLVFVDQARLVGSSKEPTVFANRISVSMVKTDDGWLVNNIRAL
jgi:Mce-associated membrane protein